MNRTPHQYAFRTNLILFAAAFSALVSYPAVSKAQAFWGQYAGNDQHSALSTVASQNLDQVLWSTPVDLDPQYSSSGVLYIHYGSPVFTQDDTVIVPVKTGAYGGFELEGINGATGAVKWTETTDYSVPPHDWFPSYAPAITPNGTLYYGGAGGTVYSVTNLDSSAPTTPRQTAFYGNSAYAANMAAYNAAIQICTPLTTAANGNVYFGYRVDGTLPAGAPAGLASGIACVTPGGAVTYMSASAATGGLAIQVPIGCAPALSANGQTVYVGMSNSAQGGYLLALNATTLATQSMVMVKDPRNGNQALELDDSTASPMVAPDGSVYYGVFENPYYSSKGWMLHFSANLSTQYTPGLFGWDDTASIVPASMVPSYTGGSSYLIMTKYNNYYETGGNGLNMVAILDPNNTQVDSRTGVTVMAVVESVVSPTPDPSYPGTGATTEWCINSAVVDPFTDSVLVNNEDGSLFKWNLATDTLSEGINLTSGVGEAYTPTIIGPNGAVYAINDATLFSVGNFTSMPGTPEPGALTFLLGGGAAFAVAGWRRLRRRFKS